jgi:tol-pal system protein YbgF
MAWFRSGVDLPGKSLNYRPYARFWVLLLILSTGTALAQSTKQRVSTVEQEVSRLERLLENNRAVQTDMLQRIQLLQRENQELRNELEILQFESTRAEDRQRQLYIDLDQRLQSLEFGSSGGGQAGGVPGTDGQATLSDSAAYQAAFDLLKAGRYEKAGAGFEAFLAEYSDSELRDNAQYWLAETNYVRKNFAVALTGFQEVITGYPASRKIPDAWLKIGYCNYELENWTEARRALTTVTTQYPETTAARLAKERITLMDTNGK